MAPDQSSDTLRQSLKNALDLETRGKIKEAIAELERAIKANPGEGSLYNRLGDLYMKQNNNREALSAFRRGIEAYRQDNLYRNALSLCNKVQRYDPSDLAISFTIAQLLVDLDAKNDALIYLFSYIERQMAAGNKAEVTKALDYMKSLKVTDAKTNEKIAQLYQTMGYKKEAEAVRSVNPQPAATPVLQVVPKAEPVKAEKRAEHAPQKPAPTLHDTRLLEATDRLTDNTRQFKELLADADKALTELRKAMRLDEVVMALDRSITAFSDRQRESLALFQKSLHLNLDTLQRSIKDLQEGGATQRHDIELFLKGMKQAIESVGEREAALSREMERTLVQVSRSFESNSSQIVAQLNDLTACHLSTSEKLCAKMEDAKQYNASLVQVSTELRKGLEQITNHLTRSILAEETQRRRRRKFGMALLAGIAVLIVLTAISLFM